MPQGAPGVPSAYTISCSPPAATIALRPASDWPAIASTVAALERSSAAHWIASAEGGGASGSTGCTLRSASAASTSPPSIRAGSSAPSYRQKPSNRSTFDRARSRGASAAGSAVASGSSSARSKGSLSGAPKLARHMGASASRESASAACACSAGCVLIDGCTIASSGETVSPRRSVSRPSAEPASAASAAQAPAKSTQHGSLAAAETGCLTIDMSDAPQVASATEPAPASHRPLTSLVAVSTACAVSGVALSAGVNAASA